MTGGASATAVVALAGWATCVVVLAGCATEPSTGDLIAETTVLADTTVVRTTSGSVWGGEIEIVEEVSIGALEGAEEELFGEVFRLAQDAEGGIYVLDRQGPVLRHYARDGSYLRTIGRAGEGPGEHTWMSLGLVTNPDGALLLHDFGNTRITRFAASGEPLDDWPLPSTFFTTLPERAAFAADSGGLALKVRLDGRPAFVTVRPPPIGDSATTDGEPATGGGGEPAAGGEPATAGGGARGDAPRVDTLFVPQPPGMPAERGGPYRIDTYWTRLPDGAVVVGVSDDYSFEIHRPAGVLRVSRAVEPEPVRAEEAAQWRARFEWMEGHPQYRPPEGEWIPTTMPPFRGLAPGDDGRVWVRRNVESVPIEVDTPSNPDTAPGVGWEQPFVYDVFDRAGRYLGEVRFPDRFEPLLFGAGHVWGVRRGTLDEQYVVRLRLVEPTG